MPKYKPLKYRDITTALKNLGFKQEVGTGSSPSNMGFSKK